ncbi:Uncharacterised protein [Providencia rustigianii]|nr:Uncharacterised protein [Providencia rustigianii]
MNCIKIYQKKLADGCLEEEFDTPICKAEHGDSSGVRGGCLALINARHTSRRSCVGYVH